MLADNHENNRKNILPLTGIEELMLSKVINLIEDKMREKKGNTELA